jgi:hypothetical protein
MPPLSTTRGKSPSPTNRKARTLPRPTDSSGFIRQGNTANEGDIFPADVVRVFDLDPEHDTDLMINLQVKLDGNDSFWATSRHEDDEKTPGTWHWMEYQKQQASAMTETRAEIQQIANQTGYSVVGKGHLCSPVENDIHMDGIAGSGEAGTDENEPDNPPAPTEEENAAHEEHQAKLREEVGF